MVCNSELSSRLNRASTALRSGSIKVINLTKKETTGRKTQMSWGSAMRR